MSSRLKRKANILFVIPTLRRAGAETQLVDLINCLDDESIEKSLVVFDENIDQIDRVRIDRDRFFHVPRRRKTDVSIIDKIARVIDNQEIDIVHCTLQISLLVAWLARRSATRRPKIITAVHTTKNVSLKAELLDRLLYRWLLRDSDKVVFVCRAQAAHWIRRFPELADRAVVIYNGVDTNKYARETVSASDLEFRRKWGIPDKFAVLCCVAGFRREKGHAILVEAFERAGLKNVALVLAGDGPLRPDLLMQVEKLGLQDRIIFVGNLTDVRPLLGIAQLSVLASTSVETFSIAMLESMAMCVPVLATNIGGLQEAIFPGLTGDLVAPGQVEEMSLKVKTLMLDEEKCAEMGQAARDLVLRKFRNEFMAEKTKQLFIAVDLEAD